MNGFASRPVGARGSLDASEPVRAGGDLGWVGIVANARSGLGRGEKLAGRLERALLARGFGSRLAWTPEERTELVADASDGGCRCLVAVGGDGTVSAVVNERPRAPISVLPAGTENLFARYFGMKRDPESTAETIMRGDVRELDLGDAAGRLFTLMAGVGFDADVVTRHHLARLSASGWAGITHRVAYVLPVLLSSLHYRFPKITIEIDDPEAPETLEGSTAFLFNLPLYALGLPVAPFAKGDDGRLDLIVFHGAGPWRMLHYLWLVFRGEHLDRPDVDHRRVRSVVIRSSADIPYQLDGDPGGFAQGNAASGLAVRALPGAMRVMVPPQTA